VFYAECFAKLFNFPLAELTNTGKRIDDHLSVEYLELQEKLVLSRTEDERVNITNRFLEKQLSAIDYSFNKFEQLIREIRQGSGEIPMNELTDMSNMSQRTFQRHMKSHLGISPKSFNKVIRFREVLKYINENPEYDWQDILYTCGYYDQAHFIKDFKKYAGKTPGAFLREKHDLSKLFLEGDD
jgi:AraC-like DNA-binding protein